MAGGVKAGDESGAASVLLQMLPPCSAPAAHRLLPVLTLLLTPSCTPRLPACPPVQPR